MGDINLLGMIRKIKNSLSGFVSTSDKASKSAFGIVKVGDNISVSSGKISVPVATSDTAGVIALSDIPSGGITVDELWSGNLNDNFADVTSSLTHPLSDYKAIFFNTVPSSTSCSGSGLIFVSGMPTETNNISTVYYGINSTHHIDVRLGEGTVSLKAGGSVSGVHMYGIK